MKVVRRDFLKKKSIISPILGNIYRERVYKSYYRNIAYWRNIYILIPIVSGRSYMTFINKNDNYKKINPIFVLKNIWSEYFPFK